MKLHLWGAFGSVCWLSFIFFLVVYNDDHFWNLSANELGDFLAGASAPLAFLWLVLGYFQQGRELRISSEELKLSVEQQERMAVAANKQLEQDRLRFKSEMEQLRQREASHFIVRRHTENSVKAGIGVYDKKISYDIVNVGGPAAHVDLLLLKGGATYRYKPVQYWDRGSADHLAIQLNKADHVPGMKEFHQEFEGFLKIRFVDRVNGRVEEVYKISEQLGSDESVFEKIEKPQIKGIA